MVASGLYCAGLFSVPLMRSRSVSWVILRGLLQYMGYIQCFLFIEPKGALVQGWLISCLCYSQMAGSQ